MKFTIERQLFEEALAPVISVVEKREMLPVLSNVLIKLDHEKGLQVLGTDLEIVASNVVSSVKGEGGTTTVNAKRLFDVIKNMDDGGVQCSVEESRFIVENLTSKFELNTLPPNDFPDTYEKLSPGDVNTIDVDCETLKLAIAKTQYAMAVQDVRHYLTGMLLAVKGNNLTCVASDGHRLATSTISVNGEEEVHYQGQIILPKKAVNELSRLAASSSHKTVQLIIGQNSVRFGSGDIEYYSKLVDGKFADYEVIVNRQLPIVVEINRDELSTLISRGIVLTDDRMKGGFITLSDGQITLDIKNSGGEFFTQSIPAAFEPLIDEDIRMGFNLQYLLDCVRSIDSDRIKLNFKDAREGCIGKSTVVKEGGEVQLESAFIVMPMRI